MGTKIIVILIFSTIVLVVLKYAYKWMVRNFSQKTTQDTCCEVKKCCDTKKKTSITCCDSTKNNSENKNNSTRTNKILENLRNANKKLKADHDKITGNNTSTDES
jgi:hypothetical protein